MTLKLFNMKKCEKYNMKQAFAEKHDFDFSVSYVHTSVVAGRRVTVLKPVNAFALFGITVVEAQKIAKSINVLPQYICTITLITD